MQAAQPHEVKDPSELRPIPGTKVIRGMDAPEISDDELQGIFRGRPRAEQRKLAVKNWQIRTTARQADMVSRIAKQESSSTSAVVRRAVDEYLNRHHSQSKMRTI